MTELLGIVTGFGGLSEEVLALANRRPGSGNYVRLIVKPWIPRPTNLFGVFSNRFDTSKGVPIDPFRFLEVERALDQSKIKNVFFTGDFPRDRYLQAHFRKIWGGFDKIADEKCYRYFNETDSDLSPPVRYFLALSRLLDDLKTKPLLANEIFPELNISAGCSSIVSPAPEIVALLPNLIVSVGKHLALTPRKNRMRFAQAVIVDHGMILEVEARGTNDLIYRYGKNKIRPRMPFLLKPPSVEFNPALDQPTIGPDTIEYCSAAGVRGIVVCAETTTIVNKAVTIQRVNDCGMFLYALPFSELQRTYVQHFPNTWMRNAAIAGPLRSESLLRQTGA